VKKFTVGILVALLAVSLVLSGCSKPSQPSTTEPKYKIVLYLISVEEEITLLTICLYGLVRLAEEFKGYIKDDPTMLTTGPRWSLSTWNLKRVAKTENSFFVL